MSISKEDELYYNNYFNMFRSEGWKQLMEEFKANAELLDQVTHIKDAEELRNRQGQLTILNNLINLEDMLTLAHDDVDADA